jgi:hypoxanthine phosphoribosyltransferase
MDEEGGSDKRPTVSKDVMNKQAEKMSKEFNLRWRIWLCREELKSIAIELERNENYLASLQDWMTEAVETKNEDADAWRTYYSNKKKASADRELLLKMEKEYKDTLPDLYEQYYEFYET